MNEFVTEEEIPMKMLQIDPEIEKKLVEQLKKVKIQRNEAKVQEALNKPSSVRQNKKT